MRYAPVHEDADGSLTCDALDREDMRLPESWEDEVLNVQDIPLRDVIALRTPRFIVVA